MNFRRTGSIRCAWPFLLIACVATAASQTATNDLFNDHVIQQVSLSVNPSDWASLLQNYQDDTYYHAQLSWNGTVLNVGIRSHGNGSRSGIKPNLDVNIAKYIKTQTLDGIIVFHPDCQ